MGRQYTAETLRRAARLDPAADSGLVNRVTSEDAGWELLSVEIRRLAPGETFTAETGDDEVVIVLLGGRAGVKSSHGAWEQIGARRHVFEGLPWALYLPRSSSFELTAQTPVELAFARVPSERDHPARLITPDDIRPQVRGGHNNTRQINDIIPPGFDCDRIVCCEVYTPSGNWSSYPPHKHDVHRESEGRVIEADLEEVYCYKFNRPEGWAFQRIYTDDRSIDAAVVARDGDIVLIPEGYHPVATGYGYDCYYLNFLAGSAQSLAATDDPAHAWVKETWTETDPRVPMVTK